MLFCNEYVNTLKNPIKMFQKTTEIFIHNIFIRDIYFVWENHVLKHCEQPSSKPDAGGDSDDVDAQAGSHGPHPPTHPPIYTHTHTHTNSPTHTRARARRVSRGYILFGVTCIIIIIIVIADVIVIVVFAAASLLRLLSYSPTANITPATHTALNDRHSVSKFKLTNCRGRGITKYTS